MGRSIKVVEARFDCDSDSADDSHPSIIDRSRVILLHGMVTESGISQVVAQLLQFADCSNKPINLIISTYGGSVDEMFGLYDTIKFLPCPVHTIALGKVMSAGVLLLASGVKGRRLIGKSARIMMHTISAGAWGSTMDIITHADETKRIQHQLNLALCSETRMNEAQVAEIMKSGLDRYITPPEALEYGIVDKIIGEDRVP